MCNCTTYALKSTLAIFVTLGNVNMNSNTLINVTSGNLSLQKTNSKQIFYILFSSYSVVNNVMYSFSIQTE